jgi:hypothetical protein
VEIKNFFTSFEDADSGVDSSVEVLEAFEPFPPHFPEVFGASGTSFGDPRSTFYTSVTKERPDIPPAVGVTADVDGIFLNICVMSLLIQPANILAIRACEGNVCRINSASNNALQLFTNSLYTKMSSLKFRTRMCTELGFDR